MPKIIENLNSQFEAEEAACIRADQLIKQGGIIGSVVGRFQKWVHTNELEQITDELDVAELYAHLGKEYLPSDQAQ
jgi:hypothetical protein